MSTNNQNPDAQPTRPATTKPSVSSRGGGMPRIMWLAVLVCILGAAFLFRSQNDDAPVGIGESQTVVTAPEVESSPTASQPPRSGDVNIAEAAPALTPEETTTAAAAKPREEPTAQPTTTPPRRKAPTPKHKAPAAATVKPLVHGAYVVQVGSFGEAANADKEASRLSKSGWDARVKVGNTSAGDIIYRVHIGYFKSRGDATTFIRQNHKLLRGAIAVHR